MSAEDRIKALEQERDSLKEQLDAAQDVKSSLRRNVEALAEDVKVLKEQLAGAHAINCTCKHEPSKSAFRCDALADPRCAEMRRG
jgi:phage shock protein A